MGELYLESLDKMALRLGSSTDPPYDVLHLSTGATIVILSGPPEVEAEANRRVEYSQRVAQVPPDDPATLARIQALLSRPSLPREITDFCEG